MISRHIRWPLAAAPSFADGERDARTNRKRRTPLANRILLTVFAGLIAMLAATALQVAVAQAEDDGEEGAPTEALSLQPGDNFVGWVAEPVAVVDLFEQIPEATLIYRWDADSRAWWYAINASGDPHGNLRTLEPGMAAKVRIGGERSVEWEHALTPAKGMVTLYSGENWVAWNGRDEWPINRVARGIGTSLVSIEVEARGIVYQPGGDLAETLDPFSGGIAIRRGDALRVTVNRDLRWLQPTGMMPNIVWVGDVARTLKDTMTAEIGELLDYFAETHGVETDFSDTTILIWETVDDAVAYQDANPEFPFHISGERLRTYLEHDAEGGGTAWGVHLKSSWWHPNPRLSIFKTLLTHEWFHYLQIQYTDFWQTSGLPPEWMLEGTARWSGDLGIRIAEGHQSFRETRRDDLSAAKRTAATLRSAERRNTPWQYVLGLLAVDVLVERSGADSIVEYFRQQHPQAVGRDRRWQSRTTLNEAFLAAFGVHQRDFYTMFEAWRDALPGRQVRDSGDPKLRGSLSDADGAPATGFWINAAPYHGEHKAGRLRRAEVLEDGSFTLELLGDTVQRLTLERDGCQLWLTDEGLTRVQPRPGQYRDLDTRSLPRLNLTLPDGACENELRLSVSTLRGDDRRVEVALVGDGTWEWASSSGNSTFAAEPGRYRVMARVGGCDLWYGDNGMVAFREDGESVELGGDPVLIEIRIPDDLCVRSISGRVLATDGNAVDVGWLDLGAGGMDGGGFASAVGSFKIAVPDSGDYYLSFGANVARCRIIYGKPGATSDWQRATPITVADQDVTGIEFVLPTNPAKLCS